MGFPNSFLIQSTKKHFVLRKTSSFWSNDRTFHGWGNEREAKPKSCPDLLALNSFKKKISTLYCYIKFYLWPGGEETKKKEKRNPSSGVLRSFLFLQTVESDF